MGDVVDIRQFRPSCENCRWHGASTCLRPGGWHWDKKFSRCIDFERKQGDKE